MYFQKKTSKIIVLTLKINYTFLFSIAYVTSHKANCRAGAFSMDGSLCATGSVDASIKILDVDRMLAKSQIESMASGNKPVDPGSHPVIRTLYDHVEVRIKKVKFSPF